MSLQYDLEMGAIAAVGPAPNPPPTKYERLIAKAKEITDKPPAREEPAADHQRR